MAGSANYKWWAFAAIAAGTFTSVVDHGTVIVGYALTISALLLPMGRLSDIVGRKQVYLAGFVVYVIAAALAAYRSTSRP